MTTASPATRPAAAPAPVPCHDQLDLGTLFRDHREELEQFLRARGGQPTLVEDLAQDVFERVARWTQRHRWEDRGRSPVALLFTVARNLLYDHAHSPRRREVPVAEFDERRPGIWSAPEQLPDDLIAGRLQAAGWRRALVDAFQDLTRPQRRVLQLVYVEGLTRSEIAHQLGLSARAVNACHYRAMQRLRTSPAVRALAQRSEAIR